MKGKKLTACRLFPVQVVPLFDVMDLVELVTMMASVGEQFESSGATCNKDFPLTAESCKWLTWKMDGLSEVESQKISACFPTISSLIEATEERLRVDLGVELAAQVSSMLQSDFHIE